MKPFQLFISKSLPKHSSRHNSGFIQRKPPTCCPSPIYIYITLQPCECYAPWRSHELIAPNWRSRSKYCGNTLISRSPSNSSPSPPRRSWSRPPPPLPPPPPHCHRSPQGRPGRAREGEGGEREESGKRRGRREG